MSHIVSMYCMYVMDPSTLDYIKYLGRYRVLVYSTLYVSARAGPGSVYAL